MEKLTHKKLIREHLRRFGSITPLEALREYGCYRLGAVVFNLRRDESLPIITERQEAVSKITGNTVRYAKYILQ